jgi:hypothetical protein
MHELNCMVWLVKLIIELDCTWVEIHDFTTWLKKYFWCFNKRQGSIIYRNLSSIQVHGLMVIKLSSMNFTLVFENYPIRTSYPKIQHSDWTILEDVYKTCTQKSFMTVTPIHQWDSCSTRNKV